MNDSRRQLQHPTSSATNKAEGPANRLAGLEIHQVENLRRSVAMLSPGQQALNREEALAILRGYQAADGEVRRLRAQLDDHRPDEMPNSEMPDSEMPDS